MDQCIVHMRQDAFLPVEGVGLVSHVPGLQGIHLCQKKGMTAFIWVLLQSMVCPVSIACLQRQINQDGHYFVSAHLCSFIYAMDMGHTIDWRQPPSEGYHVFFFWQRCTLETRLMRSQPHPLNRKEGILPHVYDALVRENTPPPPPPPPPPPQACTEQSATLI